MSRRGSNVEFSKLLSKKFEEFDLMNEIKENWVQVWNFVSNFYTRPSNFDWLQTFWLRMCSNFDLRNFIYETLKCNEIVEYMDNSKYIKRHNQFSLYKFHYQKFHQNYPMKNHRVSESFRPYLIGKNQAHHLEVSYLSGFFKCHQLLLFKSPLEARCKKKSRRTKGESRLNLDSLIININSSYVKRDLDPDKEELLPEKRLVMGNGVLGKLTTMSEADKRVWGVEELARSGGVG
jgi:hypothetical protein